MQNTPLVSIICLCYNHSEFVEESLNSVINQTYKNVELLIADDCSSDNSVEVIQNWLKKNPGITFVRNTKNLGNTKTFNSLFELAKGEYFIDLAADDILLEDCIEKQIRAFQNSKYDNLALVYGNALLIDKNSNPIDFYYPINEIGTTIRKPPSGDIYLSVIGQKEKICSVSSLVKSNIFEKLGKYDENLAYEDLDLWIKASRNYNFDFIDSVLIKKRELKESLYQSFFQKGKRSKRINHSTYIVLKKAFKLNTSKLENKALLKRIHNQIDINLKLKNYVLAIKLAYLKAKIHLKNITFL